MTSGELAPPGAEMTERNRELIARRLGYPPGVLDGERAIEHACPGYGAWWDGTRFGARKLGARVGDPLFSGATADKVIAMIQARQP